MRGRHPSCRKGACSRACAIRTSSQSMVPNGSGTPSASGWNGSTVRRSRSGLARDPPPPPPPRAQGPLPPRDAIEIGIQICHAVSAVHRAGLLHRDIKAQNVMLAKDGRAVLTDFGTGREVSDGSARTGALVGTPLYLAPELLRDADPSIHSDIYSLGVLLYHMLT